MRKSKFLKQYSKIKYITVCLCDIVKMRKIKRESLEEAIPQAFFMSEGGGSIAEETEAAMFLAGMPEPDGGKVL